MQSIVVPIGGSGASKFYWGP